MTDSILRRKDAAKFLGISVPTLDKWYSGGHIAKPIKIGPRAVGWRESYLKAFLVEREAQGGAA
ncbi:AlpA family phage regulatory protein [Paraburkholderia graminis]|uniref:helix-turn-helix transcriptional regulator n=1 Tax=Paraburkholderia graminis TaxID=60548 RepID=UPI0038B97BA1